jgi:16S rRNA (guanine(527)-N(7))-methyltransferase RsmG
VLAKLVEREGGGPAHWSEKISQFLAALEAANARVNLVSRRTVSETLEKQVLPSLATLLLVRPADALRVADVGSGAGFPGIPLKILRPKIRLDLIEATRKKCDFLEEVTGALGLEGVRVHWCRVERPTTALLQRAPFDLVFARAVGLAPKVRDACLELGGPSCALWVFERPAPAPSSRSIPSGPQWALEWRDLEGRAITALRRVHPDFSANEI